MQKHFVIATRGSRLALWQANHIKTLIESSNKNISASLNIIKTRGDVIQDVPLAKIGGKGLFVKEIEEALLSGRADIAVHSMKDMPMHLPEGLIIGCIPKREISSDCFLSTQYPSLDALPPNALIGTSSLRRKSQILSKRPDLQIFNLRGNIDTRLNKLNAGEYDAIILASAGLRRMGLSSRFMAYLDVNKFIPAVGQGAIGIECREDHYDLLVMLSSMEDRETRVCINLERAFMKIIDGGCQVPAACHAIMKDDDTISCHGFIGDPDGNLIFSSQKNGQSSMAEQIGMELGKELLDSGGAAILKKIYHTNQNESY